MVKLVEVVCGGVVQGDVVRLKVVVCGGVVQHVAVAGAGGRAVVVMCKAVWWEGADCTTAVHASRDLGGNHQLVRQVHAQAHVLDARLLVRPRRQRVLAPLNKIRSTVSWRMNVCMHVPFSVCGCVGVSGVSCGLIKLRRETHSHSGGMVGAGMSSAGMHSASFSSSVWYMLCASRSTCE